MHATDPGHTEGNMVFTYLDFFEEKTKVDELKKLYRAGKISDVEVKNYLYKSLIKYFAPARKIYQELKQNPEKVKHILETGAAKATAVAAAIMTEVRGAIGLTNNYSFFNYQLSAVGRSGAITIDEFAKVEMRVGKVIKAENKEGSDKLIRLTVDFGQGDPTTASGLKTVFTGVRQFGYTPEYFQGKQFFFVYNLAARRMMNEESQSMIMAVDGPDKPLFLSADAMPLGAKIR